MCVGAVMEEACGEAGACYGGAQMPLLVPERIDSPGSRAAFGRLFWAFFCVFINFDLHFGRFSVHLIPDFFGWILAISAMEELAGIHSSISLLKKLAVWLLALSLVDVVSAYWAWYAHLAGFGGMLLLFMRLAGMAVLMVFMWNLCGVIMDMAEHEGDGRVKGLADLCRKLFVVLLVAIGVAAAAIEADTQETLAFAGTLALLLVCVILSMVLMKRAQGMCAHVLGRKAGEGGTGEG